MTDLSRAYKLVELTHTLLHCADETESLKLDATLDDMVDEMLDKREDTTLDLALESADDEDVFLGLSERVEWNSQHVNVADEDGSRKLRSLFVVPVSAVSNGLHPFAADLGEGQDWAEFVASFSAKGIAGPTARVLVNPYLYHPAELSHLDYSHVTYLGDALFGKLVQQAQIPASGLAQTGWPADENKDGKLVCELRYLVGCVIDEPEQTLKFTQPTEEGEEASDAFFSRGRDWAADVTACMARMLGLEDDAVLVVMPMAFHQGFRQGLLTNIEVSMRGNIETTLAERKLSPRGVKAVLAPFGEEGELSDYRISLLSMLDGELIGGVQYHPYGFMTLDDHLDFLKQTLTSLGISVIEVVDDIQEGEGYFVPEQNIDPYAGSAFPGQFKQ
ncbi:DUF2863 family protein [Paraburkholderia sp. UCT31]|uniref:DUF2863 family protein n=1 Tax=Paraburkholderia sp. UCT31 TaxID=2615209 RepID=UPI001654E09E|nr:DUF2863 family protein [Paraburkholderia sp. UCT31]MBC8737074.1 DUF2863 family protein [Paraburkholderia sp. UCT31]